MISADPHDHFPTDRRVIVLILAAVLLVLVMAAGIITWGNIKASATDFERDCANLGGETHELGDETLCMIDDHVVGRH